MYLQGPLHLQQLTLPEQPETVVGGVVIVSEVWMWGIESGIEPGIELRTCPCKAHHTCSSSPLREQPKISGGRLL